MPPTLPDTVRRGVLAVLSERRGSGVAVASTAPVGGGCINPSARLVLDDGTAFFLKWNADHPDLFGAEAAGLRALAGAAGELRIPEVVGVGDGDDGPGWLLLEFVPEGTPGPGYGARLGRGLAALHHARDEGWGWERDNFIGSLPQSNDPRPTWAEFWAEERLRPQLRRAVDRGLLGSGREEWDELFRRMGELVGSAEEEGPSLLHGDLWGGNVYPGPEGEPVLIDPAVYRGHREVDLAMTELFGGFPADFFRAYREARPTARGYESGRRALYQLYYLLVHVNLFGSGYVDRTRRALRTALSGG